MAKSIIFGCLMKDHKFTEEEIKERLENSSIIYGWFTDVANKYGYAIARHGSGIRDTDIVAIPWTEDAIEPTELLLKIMAAFTLALGHYGYDKPHGRMTASLFHREWPDQQIDLSIMPLKKQKRISSLRKE